MPYDSLDYAADTFLFIDCMNNIVLIIIFNKMYINNVINSNIMINNNFVYKRLLPLTARKR